MTEIEQKVFDALKEWQAAKAELAFARTRKTALPLKAMWDAEKKLDEAWAAYKAAAFTGFYGIDALVDAQIPKQKNL